MAIGLSFAPGGMGLAHAAEPSVGLGSAGSFAVLGGETVTNTGDTVVSGDLGVSPGSAVTGFPPGLVNNGTIHVTDATAAEARADLTIAYNDAAGRPDTPLGDDDLSGGTLGPGVYSGGALSLNGTLTLDGDAESVFIFQAASTLITGSGSEIVLLGGASECNVFWQVGSSATLGTSSVFFGTVMALTSITANTEATVEGRLLARNGAVTLAGNTITENCSTGDDVDAAVSITSPTDGDEITVPSADDSIDVAVTGTGEPGATVVGTSSGGDEETATVDDDGTWLVTFAEVPVGSHTVTAAQTTESEVGS